MDALDIHYDKFELNGHAPMKEKIVRANNASFMNKILSKAVMTRSRLHNKYINMPSEANERNYKKYRNYCVNQFKRENRKYFNDIAIKKLTDNKTFWKTVKPLFSDRHTQDRKIVLVEGEKIISEDKAMTYTMNTFFAHAVEELNIIGYQVENQNSLQLDDSVLNAINKFKDHPSILKIKENVKVGERFTFLEKNVDEIKTEIECLNTHKPTTYNNIPAKVLVNCKDISAGYITTAYNVSLAECNFPASLKNADITPAHKKLETTLRINYRPISILPSVSKIFESNMYDQIYTHMDKYLSPYLCGFRKGYSAQYCLMIMLERWNKALDNKKIAGAILTDLSKAFDCLHHGLLIAKLEAYGTDHISLGYIYSYISGRKQRTKVNNKFSGWSNILSGIPQGSILGPLIFFIYINDIFYFIDEGNIANYADDNTPYAIDTDSNKYS